MRYAAGHKEQTREQILRAASRRFLKGGAKAVAIGDLMRELKLTHGGFYRHFKSKQHLLAEALNRSFDDAAAKLLNAAQHAPEGGKLRAVIATYLSDGHCSNPGEGCPVAALAADISRHPRAVQAAFERAFTRYVSRMAPFVGGATEKERYRRALVLFSGMAGTVSLARAVKDEKLRASLLNAARDSYLRAFCPA